ncbi:MAG: hypothetical protein U5R31_00855 [Acidimicrobiia bacterium]|nr:hypothetical protein [Acidimicrobiia bacterium]
MSTIADVDQPRWRTDVTRFCERLAAGLEPERCAHPVAAAVALAVRGRRGVTADQFADQLGLDVAEIAAVEAGRVPLDELPVPLHEAAIATVGLDLAELRNRTGA